MTRGGRRSAPSLVASWRRRAIKSRAEGRRKSFRAPFGQGSIRRATLRTEGFEGGEHQSAVSGDSEDGLPRHRFLIPQLRLAHAQSVLFLAVIDFDLPAVEINLNELGRGGFQVGGQQISRLPIVEPAAFAFSIRCGRNDNEAQGSAARASLPIDFLDLLVAHATLFSPIVRPGALPGEGLVLADGLGSEFFRGVKTPPAFFGPPAKHGILAAAHQKLGALESAWKNTCGCRNCHHRP